MGQGQDALPPESRAGFDDFFRQDYARLLKFLWSLGADQEEAQDILQSVLFQVYLRWDSIRHPRSYARLAAEREFLKSKAKIARQRQLAEFTVHGVLDIDYVNPLILKEEAQQVLAALQTLPPAQRRVMAWYMDGYSPAEIATHIDSPVSTVRSNLRHARKALAPLYQRQRATRTSAGRRVDDGRGIR
jgi:RNA polymerase sigma-70 factor (ECF subfamily)